jgi:hypothetical protein
MRRPTRPGPGPMSSRFRTTTRLGPRTPRTSPVSCRASPRPGLPKAAGSPPGRPRRTFSRRRCSTGGCVRARGRACRRGRRPERSSRNWWDSIEPASSTTRSSTARRSERSWAASRWFPERARRSTTAPATCAIAWPRRSRTASSRWTWKGSAPMPRVTRPRCSG